MRAPGGLGGGASPRGGGLEWLARMAGSPEIRTTRLRLRPPARSDFERWSQLRRENQEYLKPWEPVWASDHLGQAAFRRRVAWARREILAGRAYPFLIFAREGAEAHDGLVGGVTLEYVRRGAAMAAALGYWLGEAYGGRGYMTEALEGVLAFAFDDLDLSRIEAACLPENFPSRRLLERCGFNQEGLAQNYLQIDGEWRDHLLYERRRSDRL